MEKKRLNLMVPDEIDEKMREMAKNYGMTLSGIVAMILKQYFDQQEALKRSAEIPDIMKAMKELVDKTHGTTE